MYRNILTYILLSIFLYPISGCKEEDPVVEKSYQEKCNLFSRNWIPVSFLENGVEKISVLNSDSCFMPVQILDCQSNLFVGLYNDNTGCYFYCSWHTYDNFKTIVFHWPGGTFIGYGPWGKDTTVNWEIELLDENFLIMKKSNYNGSSYKITLLGV